MTPIERGVQRVLQQRLEQGLGETISDPVILARLAEILGGRARWMQRATGAGLRLVQLQPRRSDATTITRRG